MATRADIVATARGMVGTRWRHQGRQPGIALDCAGLVVCVGKQLGMLTFDTTAYQRSSAANEFVEYFRKYGREIPAHQAREGSVLVFREAQYPCHCGIVASRDGVPTLIHAYALRRRVIEQRLDREWLGRIVAAFDYRGLSDG